MSHWGGEIPAQVSIIVASLEMAHLSGACAPSAAAERLAARFRLKDKRCEVGLEMPQSRGKEGSGAVATTG